MNHPGMRPRESTSLRSSAVIMLCAGLAALSGIRDARAQASGAAPPSTAMQNLVPSVPEAVSRPEGWPGEKPKKGNNHVLSSIRENPDAPIVPLTAADLAGRPAADGGVVQAQFVQPVAAQPAAAAATADSMSESLLAEAESLDTAIVVARVGPEVVLAGDLLTPSALAWLEKVSPGLKPEQIRELKLQICRQVLPQHVESLVIYVDACRTIPEDRLPEIEKKVNEAFDQQQLPRMLNEAGIATAVEYDQLLRSRGMSLDRIRKTFFERALAQQWLQQKVIDDDEIPHAEMIAWYPNHLADYEFPAKVRFEQLTVKVTATRPRQQAWNQLAAMGNEVFRGKPFAEVAKAGSEGPTAASGGGYDWTTRGSLVSKAVDDAVFMLPVGQLSTSSTTARRCTSCG